MIEAVYSFVCKLPYVTFSLLIALLLLHASVSMAQNNEAPMFGAGTSLSADSILASTGITGVVTSTRQQAQSAVRTTSHTLSTLGSGVARGGKATGSVITAAALGTFHAASSAGLALVHAPGHVASLTTRTFKVSYLMPAAKHAPTTTKHPVAKVSSLPAAAKPATPAAQQAAAPTSVTAAAVLTPAQVENTYARGNCTWWVFARRAQTNDPIPQWWGNAATWAPRALRDGYRVDHTPSPGAIMQTPYSAGGLGHVAYVESVDPDGTWHISEMNFYGLGIVDNKANPPALAASYNFIHDKQ